MMIKYLTISNAIRKVKGQSFKYSYKRVATVGEMHAFCENRLIVEVK